MMRAGTALDADCERLLLGHLELAVLGHLWRAYGAQSSQQIADGVRADYSVSNNVMCATLGRMTRKRLVIRHQVSYRDGPTKWRYTAALSREALAQRLCQMVYEV